MNSFQNQFTYNGTTDRSSFSDYLADQAYGFSDPQLFVPENQIGYDVSERQARAQLAYASYLITPVSDTVNAYGSSAGTEFLNVGQRETVRRTGSRNQWNFSYGGNLDDKFYFGASVGLSGLRYGYESSFRETVLGSDNNQEGVRDFTYTDYYDVSGSGINASLGLSSNPTTFFDWALPW
jgi:hypothetical protein